MCQHLLVPALDAGTQKDRPYQSDFYKVGFNAIPRQAREQDSFDIPSYILTRSLVYDRFSLSFQKRFSIFPNHLFLCDIPGFSVIVISLIEQISSTVQIGKNMRMAGFAGIPFAGFAVLKGKVLPKDVSRQCRLRFPPLRSVEGHYCKLRHKTYKVCHLSLRSKPLRYIFLPTDTRDTG